MSIEIMFRLVCSECGQPFGDHPDARTDGEVTKHDFTFLRQRAAQEGWRRSDTREGLQDWCRKCCAKHCCSKIPQDPPVWPMGAKKQQ